MECGLSEKALSACFIVLLPKVKNAVKTRKKLCDVHVYGGNCLIERHCQRLFASLSIVSDCLPLSRNFNVQEASHAGRTTTADDDKCKPLN